MSSILKKEEKISAMNRICETDRCVGLDLFRFVLAVEILMFHSNGIMNCSYGKVIDLFLRAGAVTMTAFFILSGYVINLCYANKDLTKPNEVRKFYWKRAIGILPSYYLIGFLFCILVCSDTVIQQLMLFPVELMGLQSMFSSLFTYSHNGGTWFISCILFCYFIYPLIHLLIKEMKTTTKLFIMTILISILLYSPIIVLMFDTHGIYTSPYFRAIEFSIGVIMQSLINELGYFKHKKALLFAGLSVWIGCSVILASYMIKNGPPTDYMLYSVFFLPIWMSLIFILGKVKLSGGGYRK